LPTNFDCINEKLTSAHVFEGPRWDLPFQIHIDVSGKATSAILGQQVEKKSYAIYYIRNNLVRAELNYMVIENKIS